MVEFLNSIPAELYTLIGVLFGGVFLKVVQWMTTRKNQERDDAISLIKEFRDELVKVREELWNTRKAYDAATAKQDLAREEYFRVMEQNATMKAQLALTEYKANETKKVVADEHPESGLREKTEGL